MQCAKQVLFTAIYRLLQPKPYFCFAYAHNNERLLSRRNQNVRLVCFCIKINLSRTDLVPFKVLIIHNFDLGQSYQVLYEFDMY